MPRDRNVGAHETSVLLKRLCRKLCRYRTSGQDFMSLFVTFFNFIFFQTKRSPLFFFFFFFFFSFFFFLFFFLLVSFLSMACSIIIIASGPVVDFSG